PGIECKLEFKGGVQVMRATVAVDRLYWVSATTSGSKNLSKDAIRFLDSFTFNPPPRPVETVETSGDDPDKPAPTEPNRRPMLILNNPRPDYTEEARQKRIAGVVVVQAIFRTDGLITNVRVIRGLGYGLDECAVRAVRRIRFNPAELNGRKID